MERLIIELGGGGGVQRVEAEIRRIKTVDITCIKKFKCNSICEMLLKGRGKRILTMMKQRNNDEHTTTTTNSNNKKVK